MSAAEILEELAAAGVALELSADGRLTAPAGVLTDTQRIAIKAHRAEIVQALSAAPAQNWKALARIYHAHHFTPCPHCIAAGLNPNLERCPVGAMLWRAYQDAPDISDSEQANNDET